MIIHYHNDINSFNYQLIIKNKYNKPYSKGYNLYIKI